MKQDAHPVDVMFRQNYPWLQRWLRGRVGWNLSVEDIAAETFVRVAAFACPEAIREPRAMLVTIARRVAYDLRIRGDLHRAFEDAVAHMPEKLAPSPEEVAIVEEALRSVDAMLRTLPPKVRSAFLMSQVDGMRYAEIAEALGVSVSMIRQYISRALKSCYNLNVHD